MLFWQMPRTRASVSSGRGEAVPEAVGETPTRGKGRARARGRARGVAPNRGCVHGAAPAKRTFLRDRRLCRLGCARGVAPSRGRARGAAPAEGVLENLSPEAQAPCQQQTPSVHVQRGGSFQSIVSTAKKAKLMILDEFGEPKRARSSGQFSGTSSGGRGSHRGSGSFQRHGTVHASMPAAESGQSARGSYGSGRCGHRLIQDIGVLFQLLQLGIQRLRPGVEVELRQVEVTPGL
uniref:Uncharacterized protein n=1 Tax=Solanum tuberosum TaxID=4113 RepID=M1DDL3_SOLTU